MKNSSREVDAQTAPHGHEFSRQNHFPMAWVREMAFTLGGQRIPVDGLHVEIERFRIVVTVSPVAEATARLSSAWVMD